MDLGLDGRVALVTGASRGLGLAVARELAQEGASVAVVARRREPLERAAADVAAHTRRRVLPLVGDVSDASSVDEVVARAADALGPVDVLVANAGGPPPTTFASTTDAQYPEIQAGD